MRFRGLLPTASSFCAFRAITTTISAARYALPDEQIDAMREHNILYDRDERGGEFFHAYTEQLDQRFFLEVIERRGGYDGYGAANAAVRLAAHAQQQHRARQAA